jgi:hypothetical protein
LECGDASPLWDFLWDFGAQVPHRRGPAQEEKPKENP